MTADAAAPLDKRGQFIAARKRDVFTALTQDLGLSEHPGDAPERLYTMLTAVVHYEYLGELERLHDAYHYLNPGLRGAMTTPPATDAAYTILAESLERVLRGANFTEVTPEELERAANEIGRIRYPVRTGAADFRAIRLFRRGQHHEEIEIKSWWGLRKKRVNIEVFDEVVLFAALKSTISEEEKKKRRRRKKPAVPPGSVMIKAFHNIASADLDALYPDVRVVMSNFDKVMMGLPALLAGVPLLLKLAPALLIVYGLLRFYAGDKSPGEAGLAEALIVASALVALGGYLMNQWTKFERRSLRYQKEVNDTIYFRNVTNNVGVFDHIIGVAEEQDCKEALLAYFFLNAEPMTQDALDRRIEAWLKQHFALDVDFEIDDALQKLDRFGVLIRTGDILSVLPLPAALRQLDRQWDGFFQFDETPAAPLAPPPEAARSTVPANGVS